jgi:hypothetical protein
MTRRVLPILGVALLVGYLAMRGADGPASTPAAPDAGTAASPAPSDPAPPRVAPAPPAAPFSAIAALAVHINDGSPLGPPASGPVGAGTLLDLVATVRANSGGVARTEVWSFSADGGRTWQEIARAAAVTGATRESLRVQSWNAPAVPGEYQLRFRLEEVVDGRTHADQKDITLGVR